MNDSAGDTFILDGPLPLDQDLHAPLPERDVVCVLGEHGKPLRPLTGLKGVSKTGALALEGEEIEDVDGVEAGCGLATCVWRGEAGVMGQAWRRGGSFPGWNLLYIIGKGSRHVPGRTVSRVGRGSTCQRGLDGLEGCFYCAGIGCAQESLELL